MQEKDRQLHLIDMAFQAEAVQEHLWDLPHEAKLHWLAAHGSLDLVPTSAPGRPDVYRFTSHVGSQCLFFLEGNRFVFIGDNNSCVVPPPMADVTSAEAQVRAASLHARFCRLLLVASILWLSWLTMMLVHECGHVLGALVTGGTVRRVVWHPGAISRTDVRPNPHPLIEICAGPIGGVLMPVAIAIVGSLLRLRISYLIWVVAGFCLIANGAYIGIGAVIPIGDAAELVVHRMPRWPMAIFGLSALAFGLWIWHRVSRRLGFGTAPEETNPTHAYMTFALAVLMTAIGIVFGQSGI